MTKKRKPRGRSLYRPVQSSPRNGVGWPRLLSYIFGQDTQHCTLELPLSTQVSKRVPTALMLGVTKPCDGLHPSVESEISSGDMYHRVRGGLKGAQSRLNGLKSLAKLFNFVACNPCQSSPSLTILDPLWFIIISDVFLSL